MNNIAAQLILIARVACALPTPALAEAGTDPEVLNLIANSGVSGMGAMTDGASPQRINDSRLSAQIPIANFARLMLHFDPARLDVPGKAAYGHGNADTSTAGYANALFQEQWIAEMRAATDAFARGELVQRWHSRIQNMDMNPRTTIEIFWPVTLIPSRYNFTAQTFPVYGNRPFTIKTIPVGGRGTALNCIELDRAFELAEVKIPEDEAEAFIFRNQNTVAKGNSAAVFVGLRITITGTQQPAPGDSRACTLSARVESIKGFNYIGLDAHRYGVQSAVPGASFATWYQRSESSVVDALGNVSTPFHAQETAANAAPEARQFKLKTGKGLVLIEHNGSGRLAIENLATYADFLFMGAAPRVFEVPTRARCAATKYLSAEQQAPYFNATGNGQWLGDDEFEIRRYQQAFVDKGLPQLLQRAVTPPRRFLLVAQIVMPEYDFNHSGFQLNALNRNALFQGVRGPCSPAAINLGSGDYIETFWDLPPAEAEALLLSLPTERNTNIRRVYQASEVELSMLPAVERIPGHPESAQVPVISRLVTTTLYADRDLSRALFSPRIYKTKPSILEAGLPTSAVISSSYDMDYGEPDYLLTLKSNGELTDRQWSSLAGQQLMRDEAYANAAQSYQHSPRETLSLDEDYTPFFPWRINVTNRLYPTLTDEQRAMFQQWSRMQAAAMR